jgi:hypothetical protein
MRNTAGGKAQAAIPQRIVLLREERAELLKNARAVAREAVKTVRDAFGGFNLKGGQTRKEVRDEYAEFKRVLREAGIELPKNFDRLRDRSLATADRFNAVTQRIEDTESALTRWRETAASVADSVRGLFNNNIFAKGGLANAMLQLEADRNDTAERSNLLAGVKGIADALRIDTSSAAFQAIATSADVQTLRDLDTAAEVQAFFAAYQDRADAQNAAAEYAAGAVTGQQIEAITTVLADLTETQDALKRQLERQEDRVEQATLRGTRDGSRSGVRDAMRDESRTKAAKAKTR